MSLLCSCFVLFMFINAALCSCTPNARKLVNDLTSPCNRAGGVSIEYDWLGGGNIRCGGTISTSTAEQPPLSVSFRLSYRPYETYTLLMVTADVQYYDLNTLYFYLIWAVTGIRGSQLSRGGQLPPSAVEYRAPHYAHSYRGKFMILREVNGSPNFNPVALRDFNLYYFLEENNMCDPVVATFEVDVRF